MNTKVLFLVGVAASMFAENSAIAADLEQRLFSAEDETLTRPASIPSEVTAMLAQDSDVKDALTDEHLGPDAVPSSWFLASEIHLRNAREKDLIVVAKGPLMGANVTIFLIFRPGDLRYELLLKAPAHTMAVKSARSNGYEDVELWSATAITESSVLCRFDAGAYRLSTRNSKPIR
jgi:hypothetical protein